MVQHHSVGCGEKYCVVFAGDVVESEVVVVLARQCGLA